MDDKSAASPRKSTESASKVAQGESEGTLCSITHRRFCSDLCFSTGGQLETRSDEGCIHSNVRSLKSTLPNGSPANLSQAISAKRVTSLETVTVAQCGNSGQIAQPMGTSEHPTIPHHENRDTSTGAPPSLARSEQAIIWRKEPSHTSGLTTGDFMWRQTDEKTRLSKQGELFDERGDQEKSAVGSESTHTISKGGIHGVPLGDGGTNTGESIVQAFPVYKFRYGQRMRAEHDGGISEEVEIDGHERGHRADFSMRCSRRTEPGRERAQLRDESNAPDRGVRRPSELPCDRNDEPRGDVHDVCKQNKESEPNKWPHGTTESQVQNSCGGSVFKPQKPHIGLSSLEIAHVHNIVDNLIEKWEAAPTSSEYSLNSPRPYRSSSARRKASSAENKRGLRVAGSAKKECEYDEGDDFAALGNNESAESLSDEMPVLDRVYNASSLLESTTGELAAEVHRFYQPQLGPPPSNDSYKSDSTTMVTDAMGEYVAFKHGDQSRHSFVRSSVSTTRTPRSRRKFKVERKEKFESKKGARKFVRKSSKSPDMREQGNVSKRKKLAMVNKLSPPQRRHDKSIRNERYSVERDNPSLDVTASSATEIITSASEYAENSVEAVTEGREAEDSNRRNLRLISNVTLRTRKPQDLKSNQSSENAINHNLTKKKVRSERKALAKRFPGRIMTEDVDDSLEEEDDNPGGTIGECDQDDYDGEEERIRSSMNAGTNRRPSREVKVTIETKPKKGLTKRGHSGRGIDPALKILQSHGISFGVEGSSLENVNHSQCRGQPCGSSEKTTAHIVEREDGEIASSSKDTSTMYEDCSEGWGKMETKRRSSLDPPRQRIAYEREVIEKPLIHARIGRRSSILPHEPTKDGEAVHLLRARIRRRSNASSIQLLAPAIGEVHNLSNGKSVALQAEDRIKDELSRLSVPERPAVPKRMSRSVSVELRLPLERSFDNNSARISERGPLQFHGRNTTSPERRIQKTSRWPWNRPRHRSPLPPSSGNEPPRSFFVPQRMTQAVPQLRQPGALASTQRSLHTPMTKPRACVERNAYFDAQRTSNLHQKILPPRFRRTAVLNSMECPRRGRDTEVVMPQQCGPQSREPLYMHVGPSRVTTVPYGGPFVELVEVSRIAQSPQISQNVPGTSNMAKTLSQRPSTAVTVAPEATVVVHSPAKAVVCVPSTAREFHSAESQSAPERGKSLVTISTAVKSTCFSEGAEETQSSTCLEGSSSSNPNSAATSEWRDRFLKEFGFERESAGDRSTDRIWPSKGSLYGTAADKMRSFSKLHILLIVGLIAGLTAGVLIYGRSHEDSATTEGEGDVDIGVNSWLSPGLPFNGGGEQGVEGPSCYKPSCSKNFEQLLRSLRLGLRPCQNIYGNVCALRKINRTMGKPLEQQEESSILAFFKDVGSTTADVPVVAAAKTLWRSCVDLSAQLQLADQPLQELLSLAGLDGWPYGVHQHTPAVLPDVWKVAGKLQRLMAIGPLVEIGAIVNGTVWLTEGDLVGSTTSSLVLDAMLELRHNDSRLQELAADVADLDLRLSDLQTRKPRAGSDEEYSGAGILPRSFLEEALRGLRSVEGTLVRTKSPSLLKSCVDIIHESTPVTVLNFLGYRLVHRVTIFTPRMIKTDLNTSALLNREFRCLRAVLEDALTSDAAEYVRYSLLQTQVDIEVLRSLMVQLKDALGARFRKQRWLDYVTLTNIQQRLRNIKIRFLFDRYENADESSRIWSTATVATSGLTMFQRFREARFRSRLVQGTVEDDFGDQHCTYDADTEVVYVRLSAVDVREPESSLWPLLQVTRLGPHLSKCLLEALLPAAASAGYPKRESVRWSTAALTRLDALRTCLWEQRARDMVEVGPPSSRQRETLTVADNGALGPVRDVFDEYLARLPGMASGTTKLYGWDKVFYLAYARSMCEGPDWQRRPAHQVWPGERANEALSNDPTFHRAFGCRPGDPMRPEKTCSFWEAPH